VLVRRRPGTSPLPPTVARRVPVRSACGFSPRPAPLRLVDQTRLRSFPTRRSEVCGSVSRPRFALLVGVDLGRHVDPRHAWMLFDPISKYSISIGTHPRMAWIQQPPRNCQRRGGVGLQDRWRHGWRHRAPKDGFTACPATPHRPAIPRNAAVAVADAVADAVAVAVALKVAGQRPALPRVQGPALPNTLHRSWLSLLPRRL